MVQSAAYAQVCAKNDQNGGPASKSSGSWGHSLSCYTVPASSGIRIDAGRA
jgi:hypothetical protein